MSKNLGLDDFLGHQTKSSGGTQFLRGWKSRPGAAVNVFLHRKTGFTALWQHNIPRVYVKKDKNTGAEERKVFGGSWNCLESEEILKQQYRRDRDTGERLNPPVICPVCRLQELVRTLYHQGELGFTEELFKWEGDDPSQVQVLTLGGMLNLYDDKRMSNEEKEEVAQARIKQSEAWKENVYSKCNYVFTVVDADEVDQGVQIAVETTSLGDHVKECIRDRMTSLGEDEGNPLKNPCAIRWEHHKNAKEFGKKYKAIPMPKIPMTPKIEELINGDVPDIANITKPGNITTLRADLEARYIGSAEIDWDYVFGPAERAGFGEQQEEEAEDEPASEPAPKAASKSKPKAEAKGKKKASRRKKKEPEPEPEVEEASEEETDVETAPCEECGYDLAVTAEVCPQCGAEYEVGGESEEETPEPPPPAKAKTKGKPAKGINF